MTDSVFKAHTYQSASARFDAHLNKPLAEKNTNHWFHMMMALLIDEASKGKQLYVPAFRGKPDFLRIRVEDGQPWAEEMILDYTINGTKVYAVYTDEAAAKYAAELCRQASADKKLYPAQLLTLVEESTLEFGFQPQVTAYAMTVNLEDVLENADTNCLAINPGLPSQIILPPNVTHTAWMLLLNHKGAKLASTDYHEWIGLVNGCLASDEAKEPDEQELFAPDTKMSIGFEPRNVGNRKLIYEVIPKA